MEKGLSAQQRRAAEILATNDVFGYSTEQIADEVNVSARTLYRWKNEPDFIAYQNEIADRVQESFIAEAFVLLRRMSRSGKSEGSQLKALELFLKNRGQLTDVQRIDANVEDSRGNDAVRDDIAELRKLLED